MLQGYKKLKANEAELPSDAVSFTQLRRLLKYYIKKDVRDPVTKKPIRKIMDLHSIKRNSQKRIASSKKIESAGKSNLHNSVQIESARGSARKVLSAKPQDMLESGVSSQTQVLATSTNMPDIQVPMSVQSSFLSSQ